MKKIGALEAGGTKMLLGIFEETGKELARLSLPTLTPEVTVPLMQDFFSPARNRCARHRFLWSLGVKPCRI